MAFDGALGALKHPRFRRVWVASFISQTGDWFLITGRAFLVFEITGSTAALGTIYFFSLIPLLLFSQVSGVLADKFERRRLLIIAQILATVSSLSIGLIADSGRATLVNLCALAFVYGVIQSLSGPVQQAVVPSLVPREDLTSAISLQSITNSGSRIIGPALAGGILPLVGLPWLFYLNSISFLFVIAAWCVTPVIRQPDMGSRRTFQAMGDALRFAKASPAISVPLAAAGVVGGIGLSYSPQVASFATRYLADGDADRASHYYGLLQTSIGVGSVIGIIVLPRVGRRYPAGALLTGVIGFGASLALFGAVPTLAVSLIACVLLGGLQFATGAHVLSLIQHNAPDELRGRLASLYTIAFVGIFPILGLLGGYIAGHTGVAPVFFGTGILCTVCSIPIVLARRHVSLPVVPPDGSHVAPHTAPQTAPPTPPERARPPVAPALSVVQPSTDAPT